MSQQATLLKQLDQRVRIPEPCTEDWSAMRNVSARTRHCAVCATDVHDTASMTARELQRLIERTGGRCCVRTMRSASGDLLLQPEPSRSPQPAGGWVLAATLMAGSAQTLPAQQHSAAPASHASAAQSAAAAMLCGNGAQPALSPGPAPSPAPPAASQAEATMGKPALPDTAHDVELAGKLIPPRGRFQSGTLTATNGRGRQYQAAVATDGTYTLTVPSGRYTFRAYVNAGARDDNWFGTEDLTLPPGSQHRDLRPSEPVVVTAGAPIALPSHPHQP